MLKKKDKLFLYLILSQKNIIINAFVVLDCFLSGVKMKEMQPKVESQK
jgi:hypothetical protein